MADPALPEPVVVLATKDHGVVRLPPSRLGLGLAMGAKAASPKTTTIVLGHVLEGRQHVPEGKGVAYFAASTK